MKKTTFQHIKGNILRLIEDIENEK